MALQCEIPEHFLWSILEIEISSFNQILAKFDEIGTFQFLTDFTKNVLASHIVKPQKCDAHLQKADKIWNFSFVYLILDQSLLESLPKLFSFPYYNPSLQRIPWEILCETRAFYYFQENAICPLVYHSEFDKCSEIPEMNTHLFTLKVNITFTWLGKPESPFIRQA